MEEIKHDNYHVTYNPENATVTLQGSLRLQGDDEYEPILQLLYTVADAQPERITLDICALRFLNSSGISTLSKFILHVRKLNSSQLLVKGSSTFPWQQKSFRNFQRFLPGLELEIE